MSIPVRYIALLRAINVGGHTVKMEQLRGLFADIGFTNVETFIASGNVIFDALSADEAALATQIEHSLAQALGYAVATFLRTPAELVAVAQGQPFADTVEGQTLHVGFLARPPSEKAARHLLALTTPNDDFAIMGREFFWRSRTRMSDSLITGAKLEKALEMPTTMRSITTVRRLAAKYG